MEIVVLVIAVGAFLVGQETQTVAPPPPAPKPPAQPVCQVTQQGVLLQNLNAQATSCTDTSH